MKKKLRCPQAHRRNPVARNPLLGRSHSHRKSTKALRRQDKISLKQAYREQSNSTVLLAVCCFSRHALTPVRQVLHRAVRQLRLQAVPG